MDNPVGLNGIEFVEYTSKDPDALKGLFESMGFEEKAKHLSKDISLYRQGGINFFLNRETAGFSSTFRGDHGPSICSMGWRVESASRAFDVAVQRGAKPAGDEASKDYDYPAIYGIGDSLIYFIDDATDGTTYDKLFGVKETQGPKGAGFTRVDHLTNNVPAGDMDKWKHYYESIFNFSETRYFDIRGEKTGLLSRVMTSPCKKIVIPINEPTEDKSQIQEYLDEYNGSGVQHIALTTGDILESVGALREKGVNFLDVPDTYYSMLSERVPNVTENIDRLKQLKVLVDGDDDGYLLQIFTKNVIGPIFFEVIQRKNNDGFGEGNFQALFDAIERDQAERGYL